MTAERDEAGHPVEWRPKQITITRLHLEEDAGKNVHEGLPDIDRYSYIDLNRAGHAPRRDRYRAGLSFFVGSIRLCQSRATRFAMGWSFRG